MARTRTRAPHAAGLHTKCRVVGHDDASTRCSGPVLEGPVSSQVGKKAIQDATGVSEMHPHRIKHGKVVPHPRHWQALAQLVGVSWEIARCARQS